MKAVITGNARSFSVKYDGGNQAVVYENTGEIMAYRPVQEHCSDGRVYSSAQTEDDLVIAETGFQFGYRGVYE